MSYTCVKQNDPSDCGVAALATVARHYGKQINTAKLREITRTTLSGTTMQGLIRGAEELGFSTRPARGSYEALSDAPLPFIAHVQREDGFTHFIVVYEVDEAGVVAGDPEDGKIRSIDREDFEEMWYGNVLTLTPDSLTDVAEKSSYTARIFDLVKPWFNEFLYAFLAGIFFVLLGILTSFFIQFLIDNILVYEDTRMLNILALGLLVALGFRALFSTFRGYLLIMLSRKLNVALITTFLRRILRVSYHFFTTRKVGEILSRVMDTYKIRNAVGSVSISVVIDTVIVTGTFFIMFFYSWQLALLASSFVPLFVLVTYLFLKPMRRHQRRTMERAAKLESSLVETVNGMETIKLFTTEEKHRNRCENDLVDMLDSQVSVQKYMLGHSVTSTLLTAGATIAVLWFGAYRVFDGQLTVGQLIFFNSLLAYALDPFNRLVNVVSELQDAGVAMDRVFEFLELEPEEQTTADRPEQFQKLSEGISFRNVSFNYGYREDVLSDVSLDISAGETVAIVGESGAGKTTLCRLISRLYEPTEGRILLDGVPLNNYDAQSLRSRIGMVEQEPFLFNRSVRENIAYGTGSSSLSDIREVARKSVLHDLIEKLPEGYDTMVGERGVNLSAGQRQRIAIARALLHDPEIFIFDEATSHLDSDTERAIHENLQTDLQEKTVVLVAHRISTLTLADHIFVLKDRRIVEDGTHEELLEQEGEYWRFWRMQTGNSEA